MSSGEVVLLADESILLEHVKLFASLQLLVADETDEALDVEHLAARSAHQIGRLDAQRAASTFRSKSSAKTTKTYVSTRVYNKIVNDKHKMQKSLPINANQKQHKIRKTSIDGKTKKRRSHLAQIRKRTNCLCV